MARLFFTKVQVALGDILHENAYFQRGDFARKCRLAVWQPVLRQAEPRRRGLSRHPPRTGHPKAGCRERPGRNAAAKDSCLFFRPKRPPFVVAVLSGGLAGRDGDHPHAVDRGGKLRGALGQKLKEGKKGGWAGRAVRPPCGTGCAGRVLSPVRGPRRHLGEGAGSGLPSAQKSGKVRQGKHESAGWQTGHSARECTFSGRQQARRRRLDGPCFKGGGMQGAGLRPSAQGDGQSACPPACRCCSPAAGRIVCCSAAPGVPGCTKDVWEDI